MTNKFNPDYAIHVGQFLKNALNAYDMKQADLAEKIGVPKSIVNEIIKGKGQRQKSKKRYLIPEQIPGPEFRSHKS